LLIFKKGDDYHKLTVTGSNSTLHHVCSSVTNRTCVRACCQYSYTAPTQVSGFEQYADSKNTHTQV